MQEHTDLSSSSLAPELQLQIVALAGCLLSCPLRPIQLDCTWLMMYLVYKFMGIVIQLFRIDGGN